MTDLRIAVTALLDTPGVHPWDGWEDGYDKFFELVKDNTVEGAIHGTIDYVQAEHGYKEHVVIDDATRILALHRFWDAFNGTRKRKSLGSRALDNAKKLIAGNDDQSAHHKEGGSQ